MPGRAALGCMSFGRSHRISRLYNLVVRVTLCVRCGGMYMYVLLWCTLCTRGAAVPTYPGCAMYAGPMPGTEAVFSEPHAGLPAAPPATGGSPPVAGPFCAIASEVPPAKSAATIARVFKVVMFVLPNATPLTHVR